MSSMYSTGRAFAFAVDAARPGSTIVYHHGFLAHDSQKDANARDVARMARRLSDMSMPKSEADQSIEYGMGVGTLTQKRIGEGQYEYRFVKRNSSRR